MSKKNELHWGWIVAGAVGSGLLTYHVLTEHIYKSTQPSGALAPRIGDGKTAKAVNEADPRNWPQNVQMQVAQALGVPVEKLTSTLMVD